MTNNKLICCGDRVEIIDTGEKGTVQAYVLFGGEICAKIKLDNGHMRHKRKDQIRRIDK